MLGTFIISSVNLEAYSWCFLGIFHLDFFHWRHIRVFTLWGHLVNTPLHLLWGHKHNLLYLQQYKQTIVRQYKHTLQQAHVTFSSWQEGVGADFCRGRSVLEHSCKHTEHQQSHHLPIITDHWRRSWLFVRCAEYCQRQSNNYIKIVMCTYYWQF